MSRSRWVLAITVFGIVIVLLLALGSALVLVGPPPGWALPWSTLDRWVALGSLLAGLGSLVLALAAVFGGAWALYLFFQQRERDLAQRLRQNVLDTARLQEEVVAALRLRYELAVGREEQETALRAELEQEALRSQEFLKGALIADRELAALLRRALTARLAEAVETREQLRRGSQGGTEKMADQLRATHVIAAGQAVAVGLARPADWVDLAQLPKLAVEVRVLLEFLSQATAEGKTAADWAVEGRGWASLEVWQRAATAYTHAASLASGGKRAGFWLASGVARGYSGNHADALRAFEHALRAFRRPFPLSLFMPLPLHEAVARALVNKGATLGALGRADEAVAAYDQVEARFGQAPELPLREAVANALFNKGVALGALQRPDEAVAVYDQVVARFGGATELPLREAIARALFNKGNALGALQRPDEAVAAYDLVVARFGQAPELPLREQVANALVNKGATLGSLGRADDAVAVYDLVVARFGGATELPLREAIAGALVNKAGALSPLKKGEEALASLERAIAFNQESKERARADPDFAFLRDHPEHGPRFRALVGE